MQLKFLPSFVKRKGRITKKQTHSLSSLSEFSVKSIQEVEDFSKHFDKCYLEIGFGNAENIIFQAINNPSYLFIGSEVYMSGIGTLVSSIKENNINNIKIFSDDIRLLLDQSPKKVFDSVIIICPDPWPKEKHHKRRLINKSFLEMVHDFMKDDSNIYISTDWENYAESISELFVKNKLFKPSSNKSFQKDSLSKFERRGKDEGRELFEFNYKKVS
ncbi:MAG: tRNA (guanine-N(7)-)-methyltransferase [Prochlorococcus sp.]|mgnify:FL=1|jgi:tRNA (guanine-N7-)-methyltransferase|nr:MAG: tRNA (guanine-N(7)-)-methyltransferase [Prochlorococcus sp.]|tara:strand:+ start:849 stop:1496 length:648 start_codon:yes stop_codon:yes gene_type:complete